MTSWYTASGTDLEEIWFTYIRTHEMSELSIRNVSSGPGFGYFGHLVVALSAAPRASNRNGCSSFKAVLPGHAPGIPIWMPLQAFASVGCLCLSEQTESQEEGPG